MRINLRMFAIVLSLGAPMLFFAWMLAQESQKQIDFAKKEQQGITVQIPLTDLLYGLHKAQIEDVAIELSAPMKALEAQYEAHGKAVGLGEDTMVKIRTSSVETTYKETFAHTLKDAIVRVSDGSNLTLDPDLDSYYVMDTISFALPNLIHTLAECAEQIASGTLDTTAAAVFQFRITADSERAFASLATAQTEDANFYGEEPRLAALKKNMDALKSSIQILHTKLVSGAQTADVLPALQQAKQLLEETQPTMQALLEKRVDALSAARTQLFMEGLAAVAVSLLIFFAVSRSIVRPLNRLRLAMIDLSKGEIHNPIPYTQAKDEIGEMARAVVVFQDNAKTLHVLTNEFEQSVQNAVQVVASAATEMQATSQDLGSQTKNTYENIKGLTDRISEVSGHVQNISTASDQLASAIQEISAQVNKSTVTASDAVLKASEVATATEAMSKTAGEVTGIVGMITGITSKISLLALNASIEAARAGDAGKGFAVVADEVKNLASQTNHATESIRTLVEALQTHTQQSKDGVFMIQHVIGDIEKIASTIAAAIEEQTAATRDISDRIRTIAGNVEIMSKNTEEVTNSAGHISQATEQAGVASKELSQQSEVLRGAVDGFLHQIKAA